ncbi:MAG: glycoside hydrolase family 3 protein [Clostridia bacterium]|nr:glycoside hydrolase family 3 protein [Clostridia bacterium]
MKKLWLMLLLIFLVSCQSDKNINMTQNMSQNDVMNLSNDVEPIEKDSTTESIVIKDKSDIPLKVASMTIEEKAGQMIQAERGGIQLSEIKTYNIGSILSGGGSAPSDNSPEGWVTMINRMEKVSRASTSGIPILYGIDAVHGHNNVENAVIFPHNIGLGAANNPELMFKIGQQTAYDLKATGIDWDFAPAVSIVQDIRWGRSYESYSEDVNIVAPLGQSYIEGLQSIGVMATTKHYIGDGYTTFNTGEGTNLLDRGDVTVSQEALLDLYLPAYEAALASDTKTIMASFNSVNGVKMHENEALINGILREQLGFQGVVVSDWEAIHGLPGTLNQQVASAVNAGIDMLMQPYNWKEVYEAILYNVEKGYITTARIDEAVTRILTLKYDAGLFHVTEEKTPAALQVEASKALAREAVSESLVLLKNENILPLSKDMKIYLTGPASDSVGIQCGGWTKSWQGQMDEDLYGGTSIKDAFYEVLGNRLVDDPEDADVIVVAIGEMPYAEMEGDTSDLSLHHPKALEGNLAALESVESYKQPKVVLMVSGRPLIVKDYIANWDAFVMAWLPGTEALGITDVLFGDKDFKGKLPVTWPMNSEQGSDSVNMDQYDTIEHQFKIFHGLTYGE